jgi:hypothetical protein
MGEPTSTPLPVLAASYAWACPCCGQKQESAPSSAQELGFLGLCVGWCVACDAMLSLPIVEGAIRPRVWPEEVRDG